MMWKRLFLLLATVAAGFVVTGAGQHRAVTNGPESSAAAEAVDALTRGADAGSVIPADFAAVMGYEPKAATTADGRKTLVKPDGNCSAPGPDDLWTSFEQTCQTHDLGYDLLRYAAYTGGELGPWARRAIDDQFSAAVHTQCEESATAGCSALAAAAIGAVNVNSWRQGHGVPASEDGTPYAAAGAMIFLALVGPPLFTAARARLGNSAALAKPMVMAR